MSSKFAPHVSKSLIDAVSSIMNEAKADELPPIDKTEAQKRKERQAKLDAIEDKRAERDAGKEKPKSAVTKVAGTQYGGSKQKDKEDDLEEELKGNQSKIDANHNGKIDADDFKKLRAMKKEELSPKQKKIAAMAGDKETVEENTLSAKAGRAGKDLGKPGKNFAMIAAKAGKRYGSTESGKRVAGAILAKMRAKHEEVEIEERTLTSGETEKKEKYVKSMKKGLAGFKARYGSKAKNVMYATATKMAKTHEETIYEAIVNHEDIAKHLIKKHGKNVTMDHIEDAIDGMDDAHKVDKREVLHHIKLLQDMNCESVQITEGKMKDIFTTMQMHATKKGYKNHKQFTPDDYHEMGKEHGISGQDLSVIAGHKTASQAAEDLPFTPDKNPKKLATAGKHGYGPSAAAHLAHQGMAGLTKEGTGGPIYTKPLVKLGDLLARAKDMKNIKQATIVNPKDENQVVMKKEEVEQVDETMMGKAGCTSEDDKKKDKKPVDYDKPSFLRKGGDWRKSNPAYLPKPTKEEVVSEGLEDHFTNIPSGVKAKMKAHIEKGDHESAAHEAHKAGHLLKYHNLVSNAAHSFHQDHDTRHHDIKDLHPYMSDYLTDKKTNESVEQVNELSNDTLKKYDDAVEKKHTVREPSDPNNKYSGTSTTTYPNARVATNRIVGAIRSSKRQAGFKGNTDKVSRADHFKAVRKEEVSIDETATLDKYIRSMGYDPQHLDKNKKVMFAKTNAYKTYAMSQEGLYDGGQKGTQDIDTHMSPGATARG